MFLGPGNTENYEGILNIHCFERFNVLENLICYSVVTDYAKYKMKMQNKQRKVKILVPVHF